MKLIPLTQGKYTLVDDEDYEWLMQWKWYAQKMKHGFCAARRTSRKLGKSHIVLMSRELVKAPRGKVVDHINRNTLDNRKSNLRICNQAQNIMNSKSHNNNQYKGVSFYKPRGTWRARLNFNKKQVYCRYFKTEIDAAHAYDKVAKQYFGEYAFYNFPQEVA